LPGDSDELKPDTGTTKKRVLINGWDLRGMGLSAW
jgi:hypothetical protein